MVGTGLGAKHGILIKGGAALEVAHKITAIAFDKTGTLTYGKPAVTDTILVNMQEDQFYSVVGSAETGSEHPLATAIVKHAKEMGVHVGQPEDFKATAGKGMKCKVNGQDVIVGNRQWMQVNKVSYRRTSIFQRSTIFNREDTNK